MFLIVSSKSLLPVILTTQLLTFSFMTVSLVDIIFVLLNLYIYLVKVWGLIIPKMSE